MPIKVVDLFAGPGGLGEGFSAWRPDGGQEFNIAISIEKEDSAHRTLQLRALFRQYDPGQAPEAYYDFLRGDLGKDPEENLYRLPELQEALEHAKCEAQKITLGKDEQETIYEKIRQAIGKDAFILIGGPPCQAYSQVGRSRNYGARDKVYSATEDHRNFLYLEYLKIIAKFQPQVFVMENVKGMLSARVDGELIFDSIHSDLQDPLRSTGVKPDKGRSRHRYKIFSFVQKTGSTDFFQQDQDLEPRDFIIRAENYGVPQARHRVILLGVRDDIDGNLENIERLSHCDSHPTVGDVISDLPGIRSRLSKGQDTYENWKSALHQFRTDYIPNLKKDNHVDQSIYEKLLDNLGKLSDAPGLCGAEKGITKTRKLSKNLTQELRNWYQDERLGRFVVNHEARGHIAADLYRYYYYSTYAQVKLTSPKSNNLPGVLWPNHKNFSSGKFADRFRVQQKNLPGTTVTSHISKDGHYFIHFDPIQCRSLTVREAARIQTFPDNYYFVGNRTQQYVQVGNAVPPFLARQLAGIVSKILDNN